MSRNHLDSDPTDPDLDLNGSAGPRLPNALPRTDTLGPSLADALAKMPGPGDDFLDFHLLSELGRGAFGRVFLARQSELANRLVALKVSADVFGEPQMLAQLQHTNIVPIYSVHRAGLLQAVCMPYFGPTTLADVLTDIQRRSVPPATGADLVSMLRATLSSPGEVPDLPAPPPGSPPRLVDVLQRMNYVNAVLWLGARLAAGLEHAHERGILHRDLKPANVLLSDDGQPMLLDFNLSEDVKQRNRGVLARLGGTLPYMAPEHLEAFQGGRRSVDARSDLYGLGVILFELLTGRLPFPVPCGTPAEVLRQATEQRRQPAPRLRPLNRAVRHSVESIVRHCLEPDPERRYQSARQLREDLERQVENRPLQYAPEPSLCEQAGKWARRHPRLVSPFTVGTAAALLVALGLGLKGWYDGESAREQKRQALVTEDAARLEGLKAREVKYRAEVIRLQADAAQAQATAAHTQAELKALAVAARHEFREAFAAVPRASARLSPDRLLLGVENLTVSDLVDCVRLCRHVLERYAVLTEPAEQRLPLLTYLPQQEQDRLRDEAVLTLCLLARTEAYGADEFLKCRGLCYAAGGLLGPNPLNAGVSLAAGALLVDENCLAVHYLERAGACAGGPPFPVVVQAHCDVLDRFVGTKATAALKTKWGLFADADAAPLTGFGCTCRGQSQIRNDPAAALQDFESALSADPDSPAALYYKAEALMGNGDRDSLQKALDALGRVVTLLPDFEEGLARRGFLLGQMGDLRPARELAESLVRRGRGGRRYYQAASIYAQCSAWQAADQARALELLGDALTQGYGHSRLVPHPDPNLDPVRHTKQFEHFQEVAQKWLQRRGLLRQP